MKSLGVTGNEESFTEQQLRDRLRHIDSCIRAVASSRADHNQPTTKRDGVEQLQEYLYRLDMISRANRITLHWAASSMCRLQGVNRGLEEAEVRLYTRFLLEHSLSSKHIKTSMLFERFWQDSTLTLRYSFGRR
jgi:hypothetical protein